MEIGISKDQFSLIEPKEQIISYPCHLGIIFIGDFKNNFYNIISKHIMGIFGPFFYHVHDLGNKESLDYFPGDSFKKGIKRELKEDKKSIETLRLQPTKKFHQLLIEKKKEHDIDIILAITDLPLYSSYDKQIIFLFGETNLRHFCSIVSSFNLKEEFYERRDNYKLFKQRLIKEAIHEVGHLILGPGHCSNDFCVMKYSSDISDIDKKSTTLCPKCYKKLLNKRKIYNL
jgi:archaemetzincin